MHNRRLSPGIESLITLLFVSYHLFVHSRLQWRYIFIIALDMLCTFKSELLIHISLIPPKFSGYLYSKFSFGEVYNWASCQNFRFKVTHEQSLKMWLWPYIQPNTSRNEYLEYGYPHYNALMNLFAIKSLLHLKSELCKLHKAACHSTKCGVINDIKIFVTVYCRIYCPKFLALSYQTSLYII